MIRPAGTHLLHRLRVAGPQPVEGMARPAAAELQAAGFADEANGRLVLTAAGRAAHAALMEAEVADGGVARAVRAAFEQFLDLNQGLLAVCTDWQMRTDRHPPEPNDHRDPVWDRAVVERLGAVDDAVQPVLAGLAGVVERFGGYAEALAGARGRVEAGDHRWFTSPAVASYHTVWFELHEDFLATLGLERSSA